jgi:hypothetical protein
VSGHDFSRAVNAHNDLGFSPGNKMADEDTFFATYKAVVVSAACGDGWKGLCQKK